MKRVAILQSNYIPWKGYFDIIRQVDLFVFHDDLQYTKNDWRNRNKIKTANGLEWLSVPCGTSEKRLINEVMLADSKWQLEHWRKIKAAYSKAPYFKVYEPFFEEVYANTKWDNLSALNQYLIKKIAQNFLGISTLFEDSSQYGLQFTKAERVKELLLKTGATTYISGPAAKNYLSEDFLLEDKIAVEWMDYNNYPEYDQLYPPFQHNVSVIDLLVHTGHNAANYIKKL